MKRQILKTWASGFNTNVAPVNVKDDYVQPYWVQCVISGNWHSLKAYIGRSDCCNMFQREDQTCPGLKH